MKVGPTISGVARAASPRGIPLAFSILHVHCTQNRELLFTTMNDHVPGFKNNNNKYLSVLYKGIQPKVHEDGKLDKIEF